MREIYADFGGIRKSGLPTVRVIAAVKRENAVKFRKTYCSNRGRKAKPHPAWDYRIKCMEDGTDMNQVIDMVCSEFGVKDPLFRAGLKKFYA